MVHIPVQTQWMKNFKMAASKRPPIILQILPGLQTGGVEKTTLDIGHALVAKGWVSLVTSAGGRMLEELLAGGSQHFELPLDSKNPLTIWRNAARLVKLIKSENVDLIHARSRGPAWSALLAAKRTGIPFVTTYHGAYSQNNVIKARYNSVMARSNVVIANSQWTANLIATRNPWAKHRITTIHRGTDFDAFNRAAISKNRVEKLQTNWGIKPEHFTVVQLARVTGWKGQNVVIDTAARLAKEYPNLRFVLAGDAQGRSEFLARLNSQIANHDLQNQVILPGHCTDPAAAMAVADAVIVASTDAEAFGRAAVEASALEKPLIVTRIGAVGETVLATPEVTAEERTGWKVAPADAEEMAQALRQVLQLTDKQRKAVGARARTHCKANFSLSQMCDKTIAVYESQLPK
ncbi:MAG: glycosyltransferase family 4 protein [Rhizobiaceae bacterium]